MWRQLTAQWRKNRFRIWDAGKMYLQQIPRHLQNRPIHQTVLLAVAERLFYSYGIIWLNKVWCGLVLQGGNYWVLYITMKIDRKEQAWRNHTALRKSNVLYQRMSAHTHWLHVIFPLLWLAVMQLITFVLVLEHSIKNGSIRLYNYDAWFLFRAMFCSKSLIACRMCPIFQQKTTGFRDEFRDVRVNE